MPFLKQFLLILFLLRVLPVFINPYTLDDFLYSNEEIAILFLFILFIGTIERFFGQTFFDACMEKARYLRELHGTFTKENYVFLNNQKENLLRMKEISQMVPIEEKKLQRASVFFSFIGFKLQSNEIHTFYEEQLQQLVPVRTEDSKPILSTFTKVFHEEFANPEETNAL